MTLARFLIYFGYKQIYDVLQFDKNVRVNVNDDLIASQII